MDMQQLLPLAACFFLVAALYTTVGHAGASGYLAVMALAGIAPAVMRPTALTLNILVAAFTVWRFARAGHFHWRGLWPFLLGSLPGAAFGGALRVGHGVYYLLVGVVMLLSAAVLLWRAYGDSLGTGEGRPGVRPLPAVGIGAGIGLLSGLTGTGGGIFLSPIVLLLGWAGPKTTAGIAAPFILANSIAALGAGAWQSAALPAELPVLAASVLAGAVAGTWLGLSRLSRRALLSALALVMLLAAAKLFLTA